MTTVTITIDPVSTRAADEGLYVQFNLGAEHFVAVSVDGKAPSGPVAAVMLIDQFMQDRIDALVRFRDVLINHHSRPDNRITPQRKRHLVEMLRTVDGRRVGATYQDIAEVVFGAGRDSAISWKSMPLRDTVIRRARVGSALVAGGYRTLLYRHRIR